MDSGQIESSSDEDHGSSLHQVSGCYRVSSPAPVLIEHCCLRASGNKWNIMVKCRTMPSHCEGKASQWKNVNKVFPDARVVEKHNDIEVTLPTLCEDLEIAAFGIPGNDDQKRMQMAIFGRKPTQGRDWKIRVYLIDDSIIAFKNVCQKEEQLGNRLLTALAGLFVSNSNEDITIEFTALEPGFQVKDSKVKTIKSKDVWHTPENATDFACCHFDIRHVDKTKQPFFCRITVSHENDQANSEVVAYFEREIGKEIIQHTEVSKTLKNTSLCVSKETNVWLPLFFIFAFGFKGTRLRGGNALFWPYNSTSMSTWNRRLVDHFLLSLLFLTKTSRRLKSSPLLSNIQQLRNSTLNELQAVT